MTPCPLRRLREPAEDLGFGGTIVEGTLVLGQELSTHEKGQVYFTVYLTTVLTTSTHEKFT